MRIPAIIPSSRPAAPTASTATPGDLLVEAVRALAGVCDGAVSRDEVGFDGTDARFGARLARLAEPLWTAAMRVEAHRMLAKYTRQLERYGIDYSRIPAPAPVDADTARESRQDARRRLAGPAVMVRVASRPDGPILELEVPYSGTSVAELRDIPGRRWNGELNTAPAEPSVARAVLGLASRFNWSVADEVRELAMRAPATPVAPVAPVRSVQMELGTLAVRWESRDPEFNTLKNLVKAIPGRAWDGTSRCWRCPLTPAAAAAVGTIARDYGFTLAPHAQEAIAGAAGAAIARAQASRALDADFDVDTLALTLHPFQRAGVAYAVRAMGYFPNPNYGGREDAERGLPASTSAASGSEGELRQGPHTGSQSESDSTVARDRGGSGMAGEGGRGDEGCDAQARGEGAASGRAEEGTSTGEQLLRRQWAASDADGRKDGRGAGTAGVREGTDNQDGGTRDSAQATIPLQSRLRTPGSDGGDRDGRAVASSETTTGYRRQKDGSAEVAWVASDKGGPYGGVMICDSMGLGKTCQALATVEATGSFPALFVVPASLRRNWQREATKWLPHRSNLVITGQTPRSDYPADIVICNYDILPHHAEALKSEGFRAMVLDESHAIKNPKSQRTKACLALSEGPEVKLCLSGTPLPNKPGELLPQLQFLGRLNDLGGRRDFWYRYCQDYVSPGALVQLHEQLRQTCYVRRTKVDVLPELPAVQIAQLEAEISRAASREVGSTQDEAIDALLEMRSTTGEEQAEARGAALGALSKIRRQLGVAKIPAAVEWIREFHAAGGGKLVCFAHHVEVQEGIAAEFPGAARIVAGMDGNDLMAEVDRFQSDPNCRLIVVSLMAGSVGLTLTAASHMLITELPWVPKDLQQAHGRCYGRVNDAHGLNAYHLLAPGTLDERVAEILERKLRVTTAVQDGQVLDEVQASRSILGELIESLLADLAPTPEQE